MLQYAELCVWTLAYVHARSGEPAKIGGYLGKSDKFDEAMADFSVAYANQSERDHEVLMKAAREGRLEVFIEGEYQSEVSYASILPRKCVTRGGE
jgi:hypothetical protein